ncbi:MAG: ral secretion pathway protein [Gammaproteobacteria bacterium]|nr:ral secretion pathway protein [Gammaproteobacteria bacterium]
MAMEHGTQQDVDLDRTDRLPILEGVELGGDFGDDAVRMEHSLAPVSVDFVRPSTIDLPSLAESVRSVEERISRQSAENEALNRSFQKSREAESAAAVRITALERDIAGLRAALEAEKTKSREQEKALIDKSVAIDAARTRAEEALRDSDRHHGESLSLRDSLSARDATVAQVLHSLGERDAQLAALQAEHGKVLPTLQAREKTSAQLETELAGTRSQLASVSADLKSTQESASTLAAQLKRHEAELTGTRSELSMIKTQSTTYLELLRSREWRAGFDQNLFRELDARAGAADNGRDHRVKLEAKIAEQSAAIEKLQGAAAAHAATLAEHARDLKQRESTHAEVTGKLSTMEAQCARLTAELAARDKALNEARAAASGDVHRVTEMLAAAERGTAEHAAQIARLHSEHAAKIAELQTDAHASEQEMTVLMAHLREARRPIEVIEADVARLKEQVAAKAAQIDTLTEENKKLGAVLERTKGALEEREFLIRRLERSESNNANALGRIQTSMERLGSVPAAPAVPLAPQAPDWQPEFVRIDGDRNVSHALARRTRIGRASTCELQIDSSSVSRHHALVVLGTREAIIEDLNSTNGVIVNSRKVTRHVLSDGDVITLGEIVFKFATKPEHRPIDVPADPAAAE